MNVICDEDVVGVLRAVVVEGSLSFKPNANPNHLAKFDAYYIFVHDGGVLQIGTEEAPYTSKIIITMHGDRLTPKIPTFGNKGIGVHEGTLDIHGAEIAILRS